MSLKMKNIFLLGLLSIASCTGDLDYEINNFKPVMDGYNFNAIGSPADSMDSNLGVRMWFKINVNDSEFHESFPLENQCLYSMKIKFQNGSLTYSVSDNVKEDNTPIETENCIRLFSEKIDDVVSKKHLALKEWE
jgi:hypothetical protein